MNRVVVAVVVLVGLAVLVLAVGVRPSTVASPTPRVALASVAPAPASTPSTATATEAATTGPAAIPSLDPSGVDATVIRVVDGDTIHALVGRVDEKVRVIGLDSPETSKPGTPVECYAREATKAAKRLLSPNDHIALQPDPTQDERDRFDRLLAHVVLADGTLFAEHMIEGGWAIHYVYDGVPSIYADRLQAAEDRAKAAQVGLWSPSACGGDPHLSSIRP